MCNTNLRNSNVFLTGAPRFGKPPKIWATFDRAEQEILGELRLMASRGGLVAGMYSLTVVQVGTNHTKEHSYHFNISSKDEEFAILTVKFFMDGVRHKPAGKIREKIRLNLKKLM